jgi:hypothetical protein
VSANVSSRQRLQQRLGLLQIGGIEPLGEPAIDRGQQLVGLSPLALVLPQAAQAGGGPQLPRFGLLAAGNGQGLLETGFRSGRVRDGLPQQEFPWRRYASMSMSPRLLASNAVRASASRRSPSST